MVNFIDISKNNCWICQLLLGGFNNEDKSTQTDFKNECINNEYYRIGWTIKSKGYEGYNDLKLSEIKIDEFVKDVKKENDKNKTNNDSRIEKNSLSIALNSMNQMKKNDLIITRISGIYYIGVIKETAQYIKQKLNNGTYYRWSVKVEKWIPIEAKEMPGDIVGRFSQRRHPTIQRVGEGALRLKLLLIKIFQEKENSNDIIIPKDMKIILNKHNYTFALNYMNLEDLVYLYILEKNKDYQLLPSTCKVSKEKYEMDLINSEGGMITCQVKNDASIEYEDYKDEDKFDKIYLFSGIEEYNNDEVKKRLEKEDKEDISDGKIVIIRKENLFNFFKNKKNAQFLKKLIKLGKYYEFKKDELPTPKGWNIWEGKDKSKDRKRLFIPYNRNKHLYMESIYGIIFPNNCVYFSNEFNSLIQYNECDNDKFINELKEAYDIK